MSKRRYWRYYEFEILQIMPAGRVRAVFADKEDGETVLRVGELDFMGTARVTEVCRSKHDPCNCASVCVDMRDESRDIYNEVVGLQLIEGSFSVVREFNNFAGYCYEGEDPSEHHCGYLDRERYPLPEEQGS